MRQDEIKRVWNKAMQTRIHAKVRELPQMPTFILGFDTEYLTPVGEYQENVPVCWQWHDGKRGAVMPLHGQQLSMVDLSEAVIYLAEDRDPAARHIVLAAWFAQAEISMLKKDVAHRLVSQGSGLFGLTWQYPKTYGKKTVNYKITIFDLQAYYGKISLAKATAHMAAPKLHWNHADTTLDSIKDKNFQAYALHDAAVCHDLAADLHRELTLFGGASPFEIMTVGAFSGLVFRRWYVKEDLWQPNPNIREMAMRAYRGSGDYGGCYQAGIFTGEFAEYDGRSMYPTAAAALGFMPRRNDWKTWVADQWQGDYSERGIYRAQINWPEGETRRTLQVQVENREQEQYPRVAVDYWTGYELKAAERGGCKVRIIEGYWYEDGTGAFNAYLDHVTNIRQQFVTGAKKRDLNPAMAGVYKNLGNTIIGKLGQHRSHAAYHAVYNDETELVEYAPKERTGENLGGVFMPEWWVLIIGYSRAAMMDVIREKQALHANVDAVLLPDQGEEFTHMGITFRRKSSGDLLRLAARNLWQFEREGVPVRFAAGGGARDLPELRQVMRSWTGQKITHKYRVMDLVKMAIHSRNPVERPLLSRYVSEPTFEIPALKEVEHGSNEGNTQNSEQNHVKPDDAGKRRAHTVKGARAGAGTASKRARPGSTEKTVRASGAAAGLGRGGAMMLIEWCGRQSQVRVPVAKRQQRAYNAVVKVTGVHFADLALKAAEAVAVGMSFRFTTKDGQTLRVEMLD